MGRARQESLPAGATQPVWTNYVNSIVNHLYAVNVTQSFLQKLFQVKRRHSAAEDDLALVEFKLKSTGPPTKGWMLFQSARGAVENNHGRFAMPVLSF